MSANLAALAYLASGVLFILALRGLSSPETSRQGNNFGMLGMAIAIATTLAVAKLDTLTLGLIIGGVAIGGTVGALLARNIKMTAMPQLVAAFHSLIGLAAVAVAMAAYYAPDAFGIAMQGAPGIKTGSLIEMGIGVAIGAVTFTGSVIAFAKLNGNMSGAPIMLPARHLINILIAAAIVALVVYMISDHGVQIWPFWGIVGLSLLIGVLLIVPIGGADMPVVVSMLNSYSGWAAARARLHAGKRRADHHRRAGWFVRRDSFLHHVQGDEPQFHLRDPRRLWHRRWRRRHRRHRNAPGKAG